MALLASTIKSGTSGGTTTNAIDTTGATLICVLVGSDNAGLNGADSKNNTWTPLTKYGSTFQSRWYYCLNPTVGPNHTFSTTTTFAPMQVLVFGGETFAYHSENGAATASAAALSTGTITPPASSLVITGLIHQLTSTHSVNNGFTKVAENGLVGGASYGSATAWKVQTGAISASWSSDANTADFLTVSIAAFKVVESIPPTGSITSPANNSAQSGTIIVSVSASDNAGIKSVQLKADGANVGTADTDAPYSILLDTTTLTNGNHSLTAFITDTSDNTYTTSAVVISVYNAPPPAGDLDQTYAPNANLIAPAAIQFTDQTDGTVTQPRWNFGDYIEKAELNPKHLFLAPGTYEVYRQGLVDGQFRETRFPITIGGTPPEPLGTALTFDEIELNRYYTEGASGGPEFATAILGNFQGIQQRNINRYDAIHKYQFDFNGLVYDEDEIKKFRDFFYSRRGAAIGFRFFPFDDNSWDDETISLTSPSIKTYKLIRTYKFSGREYIRRIVKPCPDLIVKIGNVDASVYSAFAVDYTKGTITFANEGNLPTGAKLKVTGNYCIPVVFNSDKLSASGFSSYADFEGLGVIEILPAALGLE